MPKLGIDLKFVVEQRDTTYCKWGKKGCIGNQEMIILYITMVELWFLACALHLS